LKKELEGYGFKVFLAHEDIRGSKEWEEVLIENIRGCDVFCILLTDDVSASEFCDQETGIAIDHGKIILPMKVSNLDPYGFAKKYQALKLDTDDMEFNVRGIIDSVCHQNGLKGKSIEFLIEYFGKSDNYQEAGVRTADLVKFAPLSDSQLNRIAQLTIENNQISDSWEAQKHLKKLFSDNEKRIKDNLVRDLRGLNLL
jgi:hypothetical protein